MKTNGKRTRYANEYVLTRGQVAKRLGVSVTTVRRMEGDQLHPVAGEDGVWRFDPADLEGMETREPRLPRKEVPAVVQEERARARRGEVAARVFAMFERYCTLPEIVIATRQSPEVVRALHREWRTSLEAGEAERRRTTVPN